MASKPFSTALRRTLRSTNTIRKPTLARAKSTPNPYSIRSQIRTPALLFTVLPAPRTFSSSAIYAGLLPDTSDPAPREAEEHEPTPQQKTEITNDEYHTLSDAYLDILIGKLEARQEEKGDIDVEYSVRHSHYNHTKQ
jgi:frataxin